MLTACAVSSRSRDIACGLRLHHPRRDLLRVRCKFFFCIVQFTQNERVFNFTRRKRFHLLSQPRPGTPMPSPSALPPWTSSPQTLIAAPSRSGQPLQPAHSSMMESGNARVLDCGRYRVRQVWCRRVFSHKRHTFTVARRLLHTCFGVKPTVLGALLRLPSSELGRGGRCGSPGRAARARPRTPSTCSAAWRISRTATTSLVRAEDACRGAWIAECRRPSESPESEVAHTGTRSFWEDEVEWDLLSRPDTMSPR